MSYFVSFLFFSVTPHLFPSALCADDGDHVDDDSYGDGNGDDDVDVRGGGDGAVAGHDDEDDDGDEAKP